MKNIKKNIFWISAVLICSAVSFVISLLIFRKMGFDEGVRFAVASGSRQGYSLGFEMGYQLRDSIAEREIALRAADQFNLSIIEGEYDNPKTKIVITAEVMTREASTGDREKYVRGLIISSAQFARYKEIKVHVKFLDKRNSVLAEEDISLNDILYPGRNVTFEIPPKEVPEFTESAEITLLSALGVD